MNLESRSESMVRLLNSRAALMAEDFSSLWDASEFAGCISSLTEHALASKGQRELWIRDLGLTWCAFVIQSELFASSVKCVFSVDDWKTQDWESILGVLPDLPSERSFFDHRSIPGRLLHVHFLGDPFLPKSRGPRSRGVRTLTINDDFFDFLRDWRSGAGGLLPHPNNEDPRLRNFKRQNRNLAKFFSGAPDPIRYCSSIADLESIGRPRSGAPRHLYRISQIGDTEDPSVFTFVFRKALRPDHRVLLRLFAHWISDFFRSRERLETRRRMTHFQLRHEATQAAFHDMRNALGYLGNTLQTLLLTHNQAEAPITDLLTEAIAGHARAARLLTRVEDTSSTSPASSQTAVVNLQSIQQAWMSVWRPNPYLRVFVEPEDADQLIEMPGPVEPLGQALYNLFEYQLDDPATWTITPAESDEFAGPWVSLNIDRLKSVLKIDIRAPCNMAPHIEEALRTLSVHKRLPSTKPEGGRGIFNAISSIRADYAGTIRFENNDFTGFDWEIQIPVRLIYQYRLFP